MIKEAHQQADEQSSSSRVKRQFIHSIDEQQHGEIPDPYLLDSALSASSSGPLGLGPLDLPDANFLSAIQVCRRFLSLLLFSILVVSVSSEVTFLYIHHARTHARTHAAIIKGPESSGSVPLDERHGLIQHFRPSRIFSRG